MAAEVVQKKSSAGFRVFAALILLLILPVAAIWLLGSAIIDQGSANLLAESEQELEQRAEAICRHLDLDSFFASRFKRFYEELYNGDKIDSMRVRQLAADFNADKLCFFPAVFAAGNLITPTELLAEHETALVDAWEVAHGYSYRHSRASSKYLNTLFGASYSIALLKKHEGRIMKFSGYKGDGFIFYQRSPEFYKDPQNTPGGVFIVVWSLPPVSRLIDFLPVKLTAGVSVKLQQRAALPVSDRQMQVVRKKIGDNFLLTGKRYEGLDAQLAQTILKIFLLFLVMIVGMLVKDSTLLARLRTTSVRMKLVGLILYAVILPLSGMLYFGWKYLSEHRELLIQDAYLACQGSVNEFENGFEKEKAKMLALFRSFKSMPEMRSDPSELSSMFYKLDVENIINWVEVRDMNADVLITIQRRETAQRIGMIGKAIARLGITNFLGHRMSGQTKVPMGSDMLLQEFFEGPFGGWSRIFESPDELHRVEFGGFEIFWYWDVFEDPAMRAAFIVIDQHVRWAVRNYLSAELRRRVSFKSGAIRTFAWSNTFSEFWPTGIEPVSGLMNFVRIVARGNSPQNKIISWDGADWVAFGAPGKKLADTVMLSLFPLEEIDRKIAGIRSDLIWGVLFALLLALLVGSLFSHTIVRPVAGLMIGVQALRRRDPACKLEILQNDELGRLSATFNATTEALADVLSAKAIQTQLIPEKTPEIKGYQVDLAYLPAAELGGDYGDVMSLDSGRWLLVIGDVTGHGVSSAMVTAMIKAVVCDYVISGNLALNDMFACLNELLFTQFKRKKCMTLFAAIVDSGSGQVDCINAGHPVPLHFSGGNRQTFTVAGRPPLGFSTKNQEFPQASLHLAPGDCMVFYTDILIETVDRQGNPYGSQGFAGICKEYLHQSPTEMRTGIIDTVKSATAGELDDDLTMIIIKRNVNTEVQNES